MPSSADITSCLARRDACHARCKAVPIGGRTIRAAVIPACLFGLSLVLLGVAAVMAASRAAALARRFAVAALVAFSVAAVVAIIGARRFNDCREAPTGLTFRTVDGAQEVCPTPVLGLRDPF